MFRQVVLASSLVCFSLSASAEPISIDDVPPSVLVLAKNYVDGASFTAAGVDVDYDGPVYELAGALADGTPFEIDITPMGVIHEFETEISEADVPPLAMALAKKYVPDFLLVFAEKSQRPQREEVIYELDVQLPSGDEIALEIAEDGTRMLIVDESED